jgi:hypothetical protein
VPWAAFLASSTIGQSENHPRFVLKTKDSVLNIPFIPLDGTAVDPHLNSGLPNPLAPSGAATQSYQLPPVADLLRIPVKIFNFFTHR